MTFILETERLILREWSPDDAVHLFEMLSDAEVVRYLGDGQPIESLDRARRWIEGVVASYATHGRGRYCVVEKATGEVIGSCGFGPVEAGSDEIELGYVLKRACWGRGYATEAARACLDYGFEKLDFQRIAAVVVEKHVASRRVLEKIGFVYRGRRLLAGEQEADAYYVATNPLAAATENSQCTSN